MQEKNTWGHLTKSEYMKYTCHSGGCPGADMEWERQGEKYGIKTIAYSFHGHVQEGKNPVILMSNELDEGWEHVLIAEKTLKRKVENISSTYVRSLLCRNWFQVKNSDAIFAIGKLETASTLSGGTGWAVQMAIDNKKPVYIFDQTPWSEEWMKECPKLWSYFNYDVNSFIPTLYGVKLTKNFAGIGTRDLNDIGRYAIEHTYRENFPEYDLTPAAKDDTILSNE